MPLAVDDRGEGTGVRGEDLPEGGVVRSGRAGVVEVAHVVAAPVEHARQAISVDRAYAIANVLGVEMTELFTAFPRSRTPGPTDRAPRPASPDQRTSPAATADAIKNWQHGQHAS
jgi:hypothetical protein